MGLDGLILQRVHEDVGLVLEEELVAEELLNEGVGVDDDQGGPWVRGQVPQ